MSNNLYESVKEIWIAENCEDLSSRWSSELKNAIKLSENLPKFHQWNPLRVYTTLSGSRKAKPIFSLRYRGQEVANIIGDKEIKIDITPKCETNTLKHFELTTKAGRFSWKGQEAKAFRQKFKDYDKTNSKEKMKSDEAWLQSIVFEKMNTTADGGYHACKPVLFDRFPFQCPIPISGCTGIPKKKKGNIDILARRGHGNTHPAIWELKSPKQCKAAFEQVYIYGVVFALMLRHKGGKDWYENMGFAGNLIPSKSINIDIIVMLTKDRENELMSHLEKFSSPLKLVDENITLKPFVAYYEWDKVKGTVNIDEPINLSEIMTKK